MDVLPAASEKKTFFFLLAETGALLRRALKAGQQKEGTEAGKQGGAGRHVLNVTNRWGPARGTHACIKFPPRGATPVL